MVGAGDSSYRERLYNPAEGTLNIAGYQSTKLKTYLVGKKVDNDKIVFSKSARKDLIKPTEPPVWWMNK